MADGIVYLVGAGPGDPGLITVKGLKRLQGCDVVVYDNLIPDELIVSLPKKIKRIYVGKQAADHTLSQDVINALLVKLAQEGKNVVRLKGSDPFVFGRGGEEAAYLKTYNIVFEIVPGVTSGIGGAAYAGIPVTERKVASSLLFVSGHKAQEKDNSSVNWEWLAAAQNATLVIYMGVAEIEGIVNKMLGAGLSPDTHAAIIERGTFPTQRVIKSVVRDLAGDIKKYNVNAPSLFVIGKVVSLADKIDWFGKKILSGVRVMVTRPASQAVPLYEQLRDLGAEVLAYPTIEISEHFDVVVWNKIKKITTKDNWLIFTSENGVRYFMKQARQQLGDVRKLAQFKIAAIGAGTARALTEYTLIPDFTPKKATVASLAEEFSRNIDFNNANIIRVHGNLSDLSFEDLVKEKCKSLIRLMVYTTSNHLWEKQLKLKLEKYPPDAIMFSSGSTVKGLAENLDKDERNKILKNCLTISIGPSTSKFIEEANLPINIEVTEHNIPAMVDALLEHFKKNPIRRN